MSDIDHLPARVDVSFAGLALERFPTYPLPEHFAKKLHAYTRPRPEGAQTRVKDLLDLSLIVHELELSPSPAVLAVVLAVFGRYDSHPLPIQVLEPPAAWALPYRAMTQDLDHPYVEMQDARLQQFLEACGLGGGLPVW